MEKLHGPHDEEGLMAFSGNLSVIVLELLDLGHAGKLGRQELCGWGICGSVSIFC